MLSCFWNEALPPSADCVISVKIGARALLTTCDAAVQRTTCQPDALRRQLHVPFAHVLDAIRLRARADEVVADGGANSRRRIGRAIGLDRRDEELRDGHVTKVAGQSLKLRRQTRGRRA